MKYWTFAEVLSQLAHDDVLLRWLQQQDFELGESPAQHNNQDAAQRPVRAHSLQRAIERLPDVRKRECIMTGLQRGAALGHEIGQRAIFEVAASRPELLIELMGCDSEVQRSFWLFACHPEVFELACASEQLALHPRRVRQYELDTRASPSNDPALLDRLCKDIATQVYRRHSAAGAWHAQLLERSPGIYLLAAVYQPRPAESDSFVDRLPRLPIQLVLEYAPRTGVVRARVPGGAEQHRLFVAAFARHLLGVSLDVQQIRPAALDLSALRCGLHAPKPVPTGFTGVQLQSVTLMAPDGRFRLKACALGQERASAADLLREYLPHGDPLRDGWSVVAATLILHYPQIQRCAIDPCVTVELTRNGQLNLHHFDAGLQAQLEAYLVDIGVMQPGQALRAVCQPPAFACATELLAA